MSLTGKRIKIKNANFQDIAIVGDLPSPTLQVSLSDDNIGEGEASTLTITTNSTGTISVTSESEAISITGSDKTWTITGVSGSVSGTSVDVNINVGATEQYASKSISTSITVTKQVQTYSITTNVTDGTKTGDTTIQTEGTAEVTITANQDKYLPSVITVNGITGTSGATGVTWLYNRNTGKINLSYPTDNIVIGVECESEQTYSITTSVTNGTYSGDNAILPNGTATVTISANTGYDLPSSVTVTGATYTYNNGVISLSSPTDNITIDAICTKEATADWFSNLLTNSSTAHTAWENLASANIDGACLMKYVASGRLLFGGKSITKIACKTPSENVTFKFYACDNSDDGVIKNLTELLSTQIIGSSASAISTITLDTPIEIPEGQTLMLSVDKAFSAKLGASWGSAGNTKFAMTSNAPTENQILSSGLSGWSAFDFYIEG